MNQPQQRRIFKAIAVLAIVSVLLLLLFPHAGSHFAPLLWLAIVPVIFALLEIPSSQRLPVQTLHPTALRQPALPTRFQRPPPSA